VALTQAAQAAGWTNWADAPPLGFTLGGAVAVSSVETGTVEDDSGDAGSIAKVACQNSNGVHGPDIHYTGACLLAYADGDWRGKFRITTFRYSTGEPNTNNFGWDQLSPHYRRVYDSFGVVAGTLARGACIGCHSSVAYSLKDCDHPVATSQLARTDQLLIRGSDGVLRRVGLWESLERVGCGV